MRQPSFDQATAAQSPPAARPLLARLAVLLALLLGPTLPVPAMPAAPPRPGGSHSALARMTKLANRGYGRRRCGWHGTFPPPPIGSTACANRRAPPRAQIGIALDELRQMGAAAALDPHYLPALVAAGRAYVAVSGQDPLTGTTINPDYLGLEPELAANAAQLGARPTDAGTALLRASSASRGR